MSRAGTVIALGALALVVAVVALASTQRSALLEVAPQQALYEYHVPGDYLGGDGGMDSDYDDAIAPSEFYGLDQKGDAPFGGHGFGAGDRNPIYQGEYHEYEGGDWVEMKARPQMLAGVNTIYQETGMAKPKAAKPIVHHPKHPGLKAKAMTVAEYEAKLGKDAKGHPLPKGVGGFADYTQMKVRKGQSLYYQAAEQKARDAYLARHARQAKIQQQIQQQAAAKDKAQVKAFDAKVAKELSQLNQIDAMAETVNFIDGPEGRAQGNQVKVGGMFDKVHRGNKGVKAQALHYVSDRAGAAAISGIFDDLSHSKHGANNGALHARAHPRATARPPTDPKLTPAKAFFSNEGNA